MNRKLLILGTVGILVICFSGWSVFFYLKGKLNQYDDYIVAFSNLQGVQAGIPGLKPVDAAIVKAIIADSRRANFHYDRTGPNGEVGLMFISEEGIEKFRETAKIERFGFVCLNRDFPNHKDYRKVYPRAVLCPVCNRPMVSETIDPEKNIQIGCWYLAYITAYLKESIPAISDDKLLNYSLAAYIVGLNTLEKATDHFKKLEEELEKAQALQADISRIKEAAKRFRPELLKKEESSPF